MDTHIVAFSVLVRLMAHSSSPPGTHWVPGFVMQAEGFSPAGDVQHLIDQYTLWRFLWRV
jgi:hypothetical protein